MNEKVELRQALHRIREDASWARACFETWNALQLARGDSRFHDIMNDPPYVDFFDISMEGNFRLFFLSLGKIFDNRGDSINLYRLEKRLNEGGHVKVAKKLTTIRTEKPHEDTIEKIQLVRNKVVAHNDPISSNEVFRNAGITPDQTGALIKALCDVLNEVAAELDHPNRIAKEERFTESVRSLLDTLHRS